VKVNQNIPKNMATESSGHRNKMGTYEKAPQDEAS